MPVASGRLAPIVRGLGVLARHHRAEAEIDKIEPADEAEQFEQSRADPVGADDGGDRERPPGHVADQMAADEPGAGGAPARGGKGEQRKERRPRRDDVKICGDEGRDEDLRISHAVPGQYTVNHTVFQSNQRPSGECRLNWLIWNKPPSFTESFMYIRIGRSTD